MKQKKSYSRLTKHMHSCAVMALTVLSVLAPANPAFAKGTLAGTSIDNTATLSYNGPSGVVEIDSNQVSLTVNELIDLLVTSTDAGDIGTTPGAANVRQTFSLTNNGNGPESFALSTDANISGDDFNPSVVSIYLDTDGDGLFNPANDTLYVAGTNDPLLAPDGKITIFVLSDIPATPLDGNRAELALIATSKTGTGPAGTTIAGVGEGGSDAVIGATEGNDQDSGFYAISSATVALSKSAVVADTLGGTRPLPGATITYTLVAEATGSGSIANVSISDAIPAGTTYKPNSLTLAAAALTDASGDDAGAFNAAAISVTIGNMNGGDSRAVTFQVTINKD